MEREDAMRDGEKTKDQLIRELNELRARVEDMERLQADGRGRAEESEARFRALFNSMIEGVALHELIRDTGGTPVDYRILDINPAFERHAGIEGREARGALASELFHSGEPPFLETYARVAESGAPCAFETFFQPMGRHFRISVFSPGKDLFATVFEDITERKQYESKITRLASFPELDPNPIVEVDLEGRIEYMNPAARREFPEMASNGTDHRDTGPESYRFDGLEAILESFRRGETDSVDREIEVNGTWYRQTISFVPPIQRVRVHSIDITGRKRAEAHLRRHETQYRTILTATMDGFSLFNRAGRFLDVNDRLCEILGYSREELCSRSVFDVSPERNEAEFQAQIALIRECGFYRHETRRRRSDGVDIEIEVSVNYIPDEDCFIAFYRELTEKKRLEEQFRQSQKMESVGRLAGGVAHDFNNILTAIIGNAELTRMSLSPADPIYPDIVEIGKAAERAANLTRQLLAFSRKQIISPKVLNLNDLILDMDRMFRRIIGEHIEYRNLVYPGLHPVSMDPGQVEQVLTNLVVNSRDAMPKGGTLTIETANVYLEAEYTRTHPDTAPGDYVMLAVSDTGTGMDKTVRAHLFEPFFTTKPQGKGTGLGLSTCYGIVKQNRGAIAVSSEPGWGTTMKVFLPALPDAAIQRTAEGERVPACRGMETILVVEDEPAVRAMIVRILEERGYTVLTAGDGREALEVSTLHSGDIHALITDIIMPRMGGKDLSAKITARRPAIKALFMSGYTDNSIVHHGVLAPGVEFIQKPFSPLALAKKVREMLDGIEA